MRNITTRLFIICLSIIYLTTSPLFAQSEENPVSWTFEYKAINNSSSEYELRFIANTLSGWYIYSQELESKPPIPTSFTIEENDDAFMIIGDIEEEGDLIVKYDEFFEKDIKKYTDKVVFKAKVVVANTKLAQVKGHLEYMACDASTCKPPTQVEFLFEIEPNNNIPIVSNSEISDYEVMNSQDYSDMDVINNGGMVINIPEGPVEIRKSNGKVYKESKVDIALTGSEDIVNEDKEEVIDEEGGDLLVVANISSYLKKKKKKKEKKAVLANRTIQKKEKRKKTNNTPLTSPVKWDFVLQKGEKNVYDLVFEADVKEEWKLSTDIPKLTFDNKQSIVLLGEDMPLETTEDGKITFKKSVKFKDNVMITGKLNYSLNNAEGKTISRETSFAFNQSGDVVTYQSTANLWFGAVLSLLCLIGLTLVWRARKTLFE